MSSNFIYTTFYFISAVFFLTLHFLGLRSLEIYFDLGRKRRFLFCFFASVTCVIFSLIELIASLETFSQ